ncbi:accessory gene regulator ArgB-like protein [Paenibacillus glufosinatiresistens]|uniref:accessory gene regulator ArgB-like protein n=1 Tax=Paenibacillus glufosinatiresistens TaxID=3070657 RepID=UPI00286DA83F|nr:accessory gene regulator B family protein [Paenibacillus sp. YX.27]
MNTLAHKIALSIKRSNAEQTASVEVMQYALGIILNTLLVIAGSALLGWMFGFMAQSLLCLAAFVLLRFFSGGFHLRTAAACNVSSIFICVGLPLLVPYAESVLFILNAAALILMLVFSPNPDINTQIPARLYPAMKGISVVLVLINFFVQSSVIGLAFLAQSLTVIPWERRNTR